MTRVEQDRLGRVALPDEALFGLQTARARANFALDYRPTNLKLIYAIVKVKKAAAATYERLGSGRPEVFSAIVRACDLALTGAAAAMFVVDALQGGAGTSTNMNVNEVLANLALGLLGRDRGDYGFIHPLDDVNRGQSTNDVYPTALRICAIDSLRELSEACAALQKTFQ